VADNNAPNEIPDIPDEEEEVDLVFRTEMQVRNILLGYWKHSLVIVGAGLLVALVIGLYLNYVTDAVRAGSEAVARIDMDQPEISQAAMMGLAPIDDPADTARMAELEALAKRYEAAADDTTGAAVGEALLKAAETWQRAGKPAEVERLYTELVEKGGLFTTAGRNGLAAIKLQGGDVDGAVALLRAVADAEQGVFAEKALMEIIRVEQDRDLSKASELLEEFKLRFPNSPRLDELALSGPALPAAPAAGVNGG